MIYINNRGKEQATCFNKLKDTDGMYVTIKTDEMIIYWHPVFTLSSHGLTVNIQQTIR